MAYNRLGEPASKKIQNHCAYKPAQVDTFIFSLAWRAVEGIHSSRARFAGELKTASCRKFQRLPCGRGHPDTTHTHTLAHAHVNTNLAERCANTRLRFQVRVVALLTLRPMCVCVGIVRVLCMSTYCTTCADATRPTHTRQRLGLINWSKTTRRCSSPDVSELLPITRTGLALKVA